MLLVGSPGSGKTHYILEKVRESVRRGDGAICLLTPTSTVAEHQRNQLAREGFLIRPSNILTLWKFIEPLAGDPQEVKDATFHFLVSEALKASAPAQFSEVLQFSGFRRAVADLIRELSSAGCKPDDIPTDSSLGFGGAIRNIFRLVESALLRRGLAMRSERLRRAAGHIYEHGLPGVDSVVFDGFFSLTSAELELIQALRNHADVTVTLPAWEGAESAKRALLEMGILERPNERVQPLPQQVVFAAPTREQEAEEIARRILEQAAAGRRFQEMAVVVRGALPYVPILRSTLERFGIPVRFYFAEPLIRHPAITRIVRALDAMLGGWGHGESLASLRMLTASQLLDRLEFDVLGQMPGRGLGSLPGPRELLDPLWQLDSWRSLFLSPVEWAVKFSTLRTLMPPPIVTDGVTHEQAGLWRSHNAALDAFDNAMDETAGVFEKPREITLAEFWRRAKGILEMSSLRSRDQRRNVVHVIDVYEARQWRLPVVFLCGLLEGEFPRYQGEDPLLPDSARLHLQQQGIFLPTSTDRTGEERFLFELATTRATESLVLSYPKYNNKGDENLPSFLLQQFVERGGGLEKLTRPVRPRPARPCPLRRPCVIHHPDLRERLAHSHATLSPTSVETFLQCPFKFFSEHSLRLGASPVPPDQRLDARLQGGIIHAVLAELVHNPQPLEPLFESIFKQKCSRERVPEDYRTEAIRLEMIESLRLFQDGEQPPPAHRIVTEEIFELDLGDGLKIRGVIDRLDISDDGKVLVIDYKYTRSYKLPELVRDSKLARRVQAGLYLRAARQYFGYQPTGMLFCAVRRGVDWRGWRKAKELVDLVELASTQTLRTARRIREGRIEPDPADVQKCEYCDFRDVCRVETGARAVIGAPSRLSGGASS